MAAAVLRSSVVMAFRRTRAAPARSYHGHGHDHGQFNAATYSRDVVDKPEKGDALFGFVAWVGSVAFIWLMDGDYHFWGARHAVVDRPPRMTPRRGR